MGALQDFEWKETAQTASEPILASDGRRARGIYYTPGRAAEVMAQWILDSHPHSILEPSAGAGEFIAALQRADRAIDYEINAVEIDPFACETLIPSGLARRGNVICQDFLQLWPWDVDAAIGNPPFVRLRNMVDAERRRANRAGRMTLGRSLDPAASVWMAFVLHATEFLNIGGRLALVLPAEALYVRYAFPMWEHLAQKFGKLEIVRLRERLFGELSQDVVILLAAQRGVETAAVTFSVFDRVEDWQNGTPEMRQDVTIRDIISGVRPFQRVLAGMREGVESGDCGDSTAPRVGTIAQVRIGYVSGDKRFFHPDTATVQRFGLTDTNLVPAAASAKTLRDVGLFTGSLPKEEADRLFLPDRSGESRGTGDIAYIQKGEAEGVNERYKCRVRSPWWHVPGVSIPPLVWCVFSDVPVLRINDGGLVVSNSLLCGYYPRVKIAEFAAAWYTSYTLLQCELEVHALGGGVLVMVPREVSRVKLPGVVDIPTKHVFEIDALLAQGDVEEAYKLGDEVVLRPLGYSNREIEDMHSAIAELREWRQVKKGAA